MSRIYNFGAGPAALPEDILRQAQEELLEWNGQGMSVMEISHRSAAYQDMQAQAMDDLRELMAIPDDYDILFLAGPSRAQFAMIPMNLIGKTGEADYIDTGIWSHMAMEEAKRYGKINVAASSKAQAYTTIPDVSTWQLSDNASYVYYTANETVNGVEFQQTPDVGDLPLVTDMTSNIFSREVDVSKFGLIYAGSQKNIAPAGLTIVIIRKDLLQTPLPTTPSIFDYKFNAAQKSLYYTPTSFACYMAGLMFRWLKAKGGLSAMEKISRAKAETLYQCIDDSEFYQNPVEPAHRSWMNIPFTLANADLDQRFLEEAKKRGLAALKGHRSVGGMRASLYNAMPQAGVDALVEFMQEFEHHHA